MPGENAEIGRRFWELFNRRDRDAWHALLDEEVEWHAREDEPDADVYHGRPSVQGYADMWLEMFPDLRLELTGGSIEVGDYVVTPTRLVGRARTTGVPVDEPYSWLFWISEGKIAHVREYHTNEQALEAAGEGDRPPPPRSRSG